MCSLWSLETEEAGCLKKPLPENLPGEVVALCKMSSFRELNSQKLFHSRRFKKRLIPVHWVEDNVDDGVDHPGQPEQGEDRQVCLLKNAHWRKVKVIQEITSGSFCPTGSTMVMIMAGRLQQI